MLRVFDQGGSLLDMINEESKEICPLIAARQILVQSKMGEGSFGRVFSIVVGNDRTSYVLKDVEMYDQHQPYIRIAADSARNAIEIASLRSRVPLEIIEKANANLKGDVFNVYDVGVPMIIAETLVDEDEVIPKNDRSGAIVLRKGDHRANEIQTEALISLIVGRMVRTGESMFLVDTFAIASCEAEKRDRYHTFFFMEKVDGVLKERIRIGHGDEGDANGRAVILQLLMAVAALHKRGIQHNDLHVGNVFYKIRPKDDAETFRYVCETSSGPRETFSVATPFIVKVGDFGLSLKVTHPRIQNSLLEQSDWNAVPNYWLPGFDVLQLLYSFRLQGVKTAKLMLIALLGSKELVSSVMFDDAGRTHKKYWTKPSLKTLTMTKVWDAWFTSTKIVQPVGRIITVQ